MPKREGIAELRALGLAIRVRRERAGLSQEELAQRTQLHRTYVGSVERGERNISLKNIHAFARALETLPSRLLADAERLQARIQTSRAAD